MFMCEKAFKDGAGGEELEMELRLELNCKKSKGKPNISKSSTESHEVGQQKGDGSRGGR